MLQILAERETPLRTPGAPPATHSYARNDFVAEDKRQRKTEMHLNMYYDQVIHRILDADSILIMGPGEAKGEFSKRIVGKKLPGRIEELETADKMTDHQIAANVRQHFATNQPAR